MLCALSPPMMMSVCTEPTALESLPCATRLWKKPEISPVKSIAPNLSIALGRVTGFLLKFLTRPANPSVVICILLTCPMT